MNNLTIFSCIHYSVDYNKYSRYISVVNDTHRLIDNIVRELLKGELAGLLEFLIGKPLFCCNI